MGRFVLSETSDWELVHDRQDIRGWPVHDASGTEIGRVAELIANTDSELVESIVLDNGREYPARDIELGDRIVYAEGGRAASTDADPVVKKYDNARIGRHKAAATTGTTTATAYADHEDAYRRHYTNTFADSGESYDYYKPAYRWGHTYGTNPDYSDRDYAALEPEMRRGYEEKHGTGTWERVKDAVRHAFDHSRR